MVLDRGTIIGRKKRWNVISISFRAINSNMLSQVDIEQSWVDPAKMMLISLLLLQLKSSVEGC